MFRRAAPIDPTRCLIEDVALCAPMNVDLATVIRSTYTAMAWGNADAVHVLDNVIAAAKAEAERRAAWTQPCL